ncbi:Collagen alpha-2(V) chain [Holothuria leucospilota]|uniref:Collagen alpha-2(V) chain n=1 Tax=Holothuria leucospilota TaxID=206669 RepID=A0A9Q1C527_HOLLE|nr:Collagen alpha-2(V) chain [Holothuria leucospilota]
MLQTIIFLLLMYDVVTSIPPDCDGYPEGESWEPQPCELCSCERGHKTCVVPDCAVPCANPIPGEGACCPTCPDVTQCKNVKKCRPRSFWNKDKCKCECYPVECLPGYKFNTKKCRCQCKKKRCPPGFKFDRKCCDCKCRRFLECEPGQYFCQDTCRCENKYYD